MSDENIWYLYQNSNQMGPFDTQQILQMFNSNMIAQDGYVFKVGWKDWRPVEEGLDELGLKFSSTPASPKELETRRQAAPRASIAGRIVIHNDGQLAIGKGINISPTGIFVETTEKLFQVGEQIKMSVRAEGISRPFNVVAKAIRYNSDPRYPIGYGLKFEELEDGIKSEIMDLVKQESKKSRAV
jgi:hypothetical protein